MQCRMNCYNIKLKKMKKVEKFLKHIARLEPGSAPSAGYFEEIILEAREAKTELEALHKTDVRRRQICYVAMNENEFDIENMSFYKKLKDAKREWGGSQKYMKVTISFEHIA